MSDLKRFNGVIQNQSTEKYLRDVLGHRKDSFVANLTALVSGNTNLQACEPVTLLYAGLKATALDLPLDPNLGFAYVIPFKNTKKRISEAQFQIGAKGFKQLAIRTGKFKHINSGDVREGEIVSHNYMTGSIDFNFIQDRAVRKKLPIVGYFSYFELTNGFTSTLYMDINELKSHGKKYSQTYKGNFGLWVDDFDSMAKKTVTKLNLSKNAPLSIEMQDAIQYDQSIIRDKDGQDVEHIDNDAVNQVINIVEEKKDEIKKSGTTKPEMP